MKCPKCGYENADDVGYCGLCYEVLKRIAPQAQPVVPAASGRESFTNLRLLLALLAVLGATLLIFRSKMFKPGQGAEQAQEGFKPFIGGARIWVASAQSLASMTREQFMAFRKEKVAEYSFLNIFPSDYDPFNGPRGQIYGGISFGKDWVEDAQFYIRNPYLLITLCQAPYINPILLNSGYPDVRYSTGSITETYAGETAARFFRQIFSGENADGSVRIWMVNAFDAGLTYAHLSRERSQNLDFSAVSSEGNISRSVYSNHGFFHVGHYGKNNLSPNDPDGIVKVEQRDKPTVFYLKLWAKQPADPTQKEDFAYIIRVIP
ncbi:MAG: zinc ribbon domain-containing protein [Elusimicrobiota bacterium]|jgi:hypothetical protein